MAGSVFSVYFVLSDRKESIRHGFAMLQGRLTM